MEVSQNLAPLDSTFLVIFFEIFILLKVLGCGQGGIHKKDILGLWVSHPDLRANPNA
jgi:hypothetical protein